MRVLTRAAMGAILFALAGGAQAQDLTGEVWSVCGDDGVFTWHDTRLVFTEQVPADNGMELSGYFDWRSSGGHNGREQFTGFIDADGAVVLQGLEIGGTNLVTSRYLARLAESGTTIVEGVWLDGAPGIWAAVRDGGAGTAEPLCETAAQLS
ncbi:hypothetical protein [Gymnodinialimonas hymeniacidonis]|uniref:hypothetical protein n=1 Tax=Gymnodinialimonas hymeniacidonis TaxID=3126508 RepID=UPI0034C66B02